MKVLYVGKTILLEGQQRILLIGDLHLGFSQSMRESGIFIPADLFKEIVRELDLVFGRVGRVDKVVLLGDVKHEFGQILRDEWDEISALLDFLKKKCDQVIVVKGNHDIFTDRVSKRKHVEVVDYYVLEDMVFLHGDRKFAGSEIYDKKMKQWFMAHAHPAIVLEEGNKKEKYKCFLAGKFKGKEVYVLPSFFDVNEGTDVLGDYDLGLAWDFKIKDFEVKVVGEGLEVLDFGKLSRI